MSFSPLEMHQVCSGELETGLKFFLGLPTFFPQFLQMVPQDLDVSMPTLSLYQIERSDQLKTLISSFCDVLRTLLY